ncbi:hypothetical protein GCM10010994_10950 [Chelatococcus reniformis]|uniref:Uncharacterized protein n=1 Tax=Chelatococcus reniformis TaxID=1494448 RepID=A0A916TZN5_9HYPH|nr:hypothetical protein GCM10010994_10950 [Chelatococcus reniformis]
MGGGHPVAKQRSGFKTLEHAVGEGVFVQAGAALPRRHLVDRAARRRFVRSPAWCRAAWVPELKLLRVMSACQWPSCTTRAAALEFGRRPGPKHGAIGRVIQWRRHAHPLLKLERF